MGDAGAREGAGRRRISVLRGNRARRVFPYPGVT